MRIARPAQELGGPIAKAGKPSVKVSASDAGHSRRLGFMADAMSVPDDFDRMGIAEIEQLFGGRAS